MTFEQLEQELATRAASRGAARARAGESRGRDEGADASTVRTMAFHLAGFGREGLLTLEHNAGGWRFSAGEAAYRLTEEGSLERWVESSWAVAMAPVRLFTLSAPFVLMVWGLLQADGARLPAWMLIIGAATATGIGLALATAGYEWCVRRLQGTLGWGWQPWDGEAERRELGRRLASEIGDALERLEGRRGEPDPEWFLRRLQARLRRAGG